MAKRSFRTFVEQEMGKFPHFLIYAILEWVMIILLFIEGFLAFVSNEFARFFELDFPCLLCTRLDHVFVHRDSNFYYNESICEVHKKHISSLAYCHVHKKLSDLRNMCEGCLLSFAMEKDSDFDKPRSLVGILEGDHKTYMKTGIKEDEASCNSWCSCCGDPLKVRKTSKFNRNYSINNSIAPTPSPRAPFLSSLKNDETKNVEMPHIPYTELKFFSDTESELPDEDDASNAENRRKEDVKTVTMPLLQDAEEIHEDAIKTPLFGRGNRFFGIPLSESALASPRYRSSRKMSVDMIPEPIDMNALCEGDNESILNRLKRQVRLDRKSLIALYMELDEERSASAVAVNNAMAMITRLQAEKAAVQMEALQYQRMMEEQAQYDQEAIQDLKDLALRREEEIRVLESELEFYRERYGPVMKISSDICEIDGDDDYQELKSQFSSFDDKSDCSSPGESDHNKGIKDRAFERPVETGSQNLEESLSLDFETERAYLHGFLTNLERELNDEKVHDIDNEKRSNLATEMELIRERLRDFEADIGFLKHVAMNLPKGGDGVRFLMEIAQHLRNLRRSVKKIPENTHVLASAS